MITPINIAKNFLFYCYVYRLIYHTGEARLGVVGLLLLYMYIQSNFSGSNTFGTMKISSRQG